MSEQLLNRREVLQIRKKTDKEMIDYLNVIHEWLKQQPHMPSSELITDRKLEVLLINSKFSIERTKQLLDLFYAVRNFLPAELSNWDIKSAPAQDAMKSVCFLILPQLTDKFERIFFTCILDPNPDVFHPWEILKMIFTAKERDLKEGNYFYGDHIIFDLRHFHIGIAMKILPIIHRKISDVVINGYGGKICGIHLLNGSTAMSSLMIIIKAFLKPKLHDRIKIHQNVESLQTCIPKNCLPKTYGGTLPSIEQLWEEEKIKIEKYHPTFLEELKIKTDESKRVNWSGDSVFDSLHGSFRQLDID